MKALMISLDGDTGAKASWRFRSSTEAVVAAVSHFNEYLDFQYVPLLFFLVDFQLCCVIF
jgi:hypothetical protein